MKNKHFLSLSIFIAGLCSIIYELLISTTATYFLGDGVRQFSLIIGIYLFAMGVGAYIARWFSKQPLKSFIVIEFLLGLIGGLSVPLLYFLFTSMTVLSFQFVCLGLVFIIGCLTGLEIPLLTFAYHDDDIKDSLTHVLSVDYIGGLIATLIFPFLILPFVGLFYASLVFGLINILLGFLLNLLFYRRSWKMLGFGLSTLVILVMMFVKGDQVMNIWEQKIYKNPIILNEQTPYQKIVVTKNEDNIKLFINRVIQFASNDEHRYHESIVHVPFSLSDSIRTVLVLGGGENLATREIVKYPGVRQVDIVDIDSMIFRLSIDHEAFTNINQYSGMDPRVDMIVDDAFSFLYRSKEKYDLIIADLPDPNNESLARLYSKPFFELIKNHLKPKGVFVTQSGDINNSNTVFNCIRRTMEDVFESVEPFHVYVPSFGDWGFNLSKLDNTYDFKPERIAKGLKYLDQQTLKAGLIMPRDLPNPNVKINTLDHPVILQYFLDDYAKFKRNSGNDS